MRRRSQLRKVCRCFSVKLMKYHQNHWINDFHIDMYPIHLVRHHPSVSNVVATIISVTSTDELLDCMI